MRRGPHEFRGELAATPLLREIEWLLYELCVDLGYCGGVALLPRAESDAIVARHAALSGRAAHVVVRLRVSERWVLENLPLDSATFAEILSASEGVGNTVAAHAKLDRIRAAFEARFGPVFTADPEEVAAALQVLDRRERRIALPVA